MRTVLLLGTMEIFGKKLKVYIGNDGSRYREPLKGEKVVPVLVGGKVVALVPLWSPYSPSPTPAGARARVGVANQNIAAIAA
jgi:hypothetical protein